MKTIPKDFNDKIALIAETDGLLKDYITSIVISRIKTEMKDDRFKNINSNHIHTAMILKRISPCSLKDFATALRLSKAAASAMVERMVENNIVKREANPQNRREVLLSIAPAFETYETDVRKKIIRWFEELVFEMGMENFEKWHEIMLILNKIIQEKIRNGHE